MTATIYRKETLEEKRQEGAWIGAADRLTVERRPDGSALLSLDFLPRQMRLQMWLSPGVANHLEDRFRQGISLTVARDGIRSLGDAQ